jgi:cytochrome c556
MTISTEVAGQMKYESVFAGHRCPMCGGEVREGIQEAIREDVLADPLVGCSCLGKCQWAGRLSECVKVEDCVKALRAVNAHLAEFCDNGRPFHVMAVEAARRTIKDLEYVRRKHEWLKSDRAFHEGSTEAADGLQKKAQEYERQVQKRLDAINGYYFGMIQDLRCERDEQIETVHKLNEEIDRLKKESDENTNRFFE